MEFPDIIQIRIILFVVMLGIAGIMDAKTRKIPDVLWLVFGGVGTILYVWDHQEVTPYHVIAILTSVFVGVVIWRWRIAGMADCLAVIAMAIILPVHYEFVMMPIMILVMAFFIVVFCTMAYNVILNSYDMIRTKKWVFSEFTTESRFKKMFAFLSIHQKRKYEKFIIPAEKKHLTEEADIKSFEFFPSMKKVRRDNKVQQQRQLNEKVHVQNIPTLITFLFGVAVLLLLPEILSLIFSF